MGVGGGGGRGGGGAREQGAGGARGGSSPARPRSDLRRARLALCNLLNFRFMLGIMSAPMWQVLAGPEATLLVAQWLSSEGGEWRGRGAQRRKRRWPRAGAGGREKQRGKGVRGGSGPQRDGAGAVPAGAGRRRCALGGTGPGTYRCPRALGSRTHGGSCPRPVRLPALSHRGPPLRASRRRPACPRHQHAEPAPA